MLISEYLRSALEPDWVGPALEGQLTTRELLAAFLSSRVVYYPRSDKDKNSAISRLIFHESGSI